MLHDCRAMHVLWVFMDAEFDRGIHLYAKLRKRQHQVKLGQISSNFQIQNFRTKHAHLAHSYFSIPNMLFVFAFDN